ncbi:MAG: hypothetical protein H6Q66_1994 [Firmicutes bacterium]|nr:hypothetical protein [Bacillota bacterium]
MAVSYNRLWKLLIDRGMNKTQLLKEAKISTNALAKLGRNENVRVDVLVKICCVLGCTMDDIMDVIHDAEKKQGLARNQGEGKPPTGSNKNQ